MGCGGKQSAGKILKTNGMGGRGSRPLVGAALLHVVHPSNIIIRELGRKSEAAELAKTHTNSLAHNLACTKNDLACTQLARCLHSACTVLAQRLHSWITLLIL